MAFVLAPEMVVTAEVPFFPLITSHLPAQVQLTWVQHLLPLLKPPSATSGTGREGNNNHHQVSLGQNMQNCACGPVKWAGASGFVGQEDRGSSSHKACWYHQEHPKYQERHLGLFEMLSLCPVAFYSVTVLHYNHPEYVIHFFTKEKHLNIWLKKNNLQDD